MKRYSKQHILVNKQRRAKGNEFGVSVLHLSSDKPIPITDPNSS